MIYVRHGGLYKAPTKEESEKLRGEGDKVKFADLRSERWQVTGFSKGRRSKTFYKVRGLSFSCPIFYILLKVLAHLRVFYLLGIYSYVIENGKFCDFSEFVSLSIKNHTKSYIILHLSFSCTASG